MESACTGFDFSGFCGDFLAPGPANDDSTSRRAETQPPADADRRRRPACEMVFRLETEPDRVATHRKAAGAPDGGPGHTPLAKLRTSGSARMGIAQMRRWMSGKSSHTLTPQKCEPSVQMGVVIPARKWHGGPM